MAHICTKCHKEIEAGLLCKRCARDARNYERAISEALQAGVKLGPGSVRNAVRDRKLLRRHQEALAEA